MVLKDLERLVQLIIKRVKIFPIDFSYEFSEGVIKEIGDDVNYIVHLGAESHVDNSIKDPKTTFKKQYYWNSRNARICENIKKIGNIFLF